MSYNQNTTDWCLNKTLFLTALESGQSESKMPDNLVPGESLFPGLHMDTFLLGPHMVERDLFFSFSFWP